MIVLFSFVLKQWYGQKKSTHFTMSAFKKGGDLLFHLVWQYHRR